MSERRYVALLKGINVGRAKRIAMADLRDLLSGLGYQAVATHLQSGNAAFGAPAAAGDIGPAIESALQRKLGVTVRVVVRTHDQLAKAIAADPYGPIADDPAKHLLGFFSEVPDKARLLAFEELITAKQGDPEVVGVHEISGDHCYLWCPSGVNVSLFATVDWDRKLGVTVTMRNWTTALKLLEMAA